MYRRELLSVLTAAGLVGCVGRPASPGDGDAATPTPSDSGTPTLTPLPDSCEPLPDVEGLPTRPEELNEDSVADYVSEFERVYVPATDPAYGGIESLQVTDVEGIGDRFRVELAVEGAPPQRTPGPDGETPTPMPVDAHSHRTRYRLEGDRLVREHLAYADSSLLSSECWTLEDASTGDQ